MVFFCSFCGVTVASPGLTSIDTGDHTITKVRTALRHGRSHIVASSYEGTVLGISYQGTVGWKNELSGFMNHDICCADIIDDGNDEILTANADGSVYCIDSDGTLRWTFRPNDAPMRSVCVVNVDGVPFVVCGGYDNSFYYVSSSGNALTTSDTACCNRRS